MLHHESVEIVLYGWIQKSYSRIFGMIFNFGDIQLIIISLVLQNGHIFRHEPRVEVSSRMRTVWIK